MVKSTVDTRYHATKVVSHDGMSRVWPFFLPDPCRGPDMTTMPCSTTTFRMEQGALLLCWAGTYHVLHTHLGMAGCSGAVSNLLCCWCMRRTVTRRAAWRTSGGRQERTIATSRSSPSTRRSFYRTCWTSAPGPLMWTVSTSCSPASTATSSASALARCEP